MENPFEEKQNFRPNLLTVICILTFIGSGLGVLSSLFSLFTSGLTNSFNVEQYSSAVGQMADGSTSAVLRDMLTSSVQMIQAEALHANEIVISRLILSVISLAGAILMFQLRRLGFYFYTTAQILKLFIYPYFVGFLFPVMIQMFFSGLLTAVFIVLYAVNLKQMNR